MSGDESATSSSPQPAAAATEAEAAAAAAAASPPSEADVARSDELKAEANALFKNEKYTDSIEKYSEAIELNPTNAVLFANRQMLLVEFPPL